MVSVDIYKRLRDRSVEKCAQNQQMQEFFKEKKLYFSFDRSHVGSIDQIFRSWSALLDPTIEEPIEATANVSEGVNASLDRFQSNSTSMSSNALGDRYGSLESKEEKTQ